ncbi:YceI-like domain-containing protein [Flavobacterium sp. 90]|uniref:YceI family protein n=1 Tax=unclassified Flavobacterium TaxID=196869 RepID=UPI000EAB94C0|nr:MULTISPECIES: YceI family protein [unclassified Flavobacterium]RKR09363.1 YceI-like domain-containing protein [Flavobacterium sp. 81]TCK53147.1 YceI-like domain-containing protein [Flavobacterium sp. 90]
MKAIRIKLLALTISFLGITSIATAQKSYALDSKSTFSVLGTSTLHDWEMKSSSGTGTASFSIANSKLTDIDALSITLLSESIKSEKKSMDKVAYETLKTDKQKNIKYVLKSAEKVNETTWTLTGTYTIAGVSKEYKTTVKTTVTANGVNIQGSNKITFADFGMKSPTALLGTIKTGQDLTIKFNLNFNL